MDELFNGENADFLSTLYKHYLKNPSSIDEKWQRLFRDSASLKPLLSNKNTENLTAEAYRSYGHLMANLDPLGLAKGTVHPAINANNNSPQHLQHIYCNTIGFEYMHIQDVTQKNWLQERIEKNQRIPLDSKKILEDLTKAELFEKFLNTKFPGAKRFSIEGAESFITAFEYVLQNFADNGMEEVHIGMAHRGRLSILANVLNQPLPYVFAKFQEKDIADITGSGDVKYHLGYASDRMFGYKTLHLSVSSNPSHLESINPVILGKTRARQDCKKDVPRQKVASILVHGDASFAGQGIVSETLSLGTLEGYTTGGILHFIINNQIGFTTNPNNSHSNTHCSEIAKTIQAPIFHVNGDYPEDVIWVSHLATEFVRTFKKDAFVDIVCYRRYGHNEGDEPSFTQPIMYKIIHEHPTTRSLYTDFLQAKRVISKEEIDVITNRIQENLTQAFSIDAVPSSIQNTSAKNKTAPTGVLESILKDLGQKLYQIPNHIKAHPKLTRIFAQRQKNISDGSNIDFSTAEALAFATLLTEGHPIRFSGQDSCRGTFSQRHAVIVDQESEENFISLNALSSTQEKVEIINSPLSEAAVLGFEYGYSTENPNALILWEAQFGDFANGGQIIIDQFISAAEQKWNQSSSLVMLLPHGFEGQGPEHSSARLERYLQLCAQDNIQVVNPTTPANYFHILRRQVKNDWQKPLIIMTPKSLLRHRQAVSNIAEMQKETQFEPVIGDSIAKARRVILCSGKVYYDLLAFKESQKIQDVALIRLEQLYPFPKESLQAALKPFGDIPYIWCQEEPHNMGAWNFLDRRLEHVLKKLDYKIHARPYFAGRKAAASPATGSHVRHEAEQAELVKSAFMESFEGM